jgi:hypothetical protein
VISLEPLRAAVCCIFSMGLWHYAAALDGFLCMDRGAAWNVSHLVFPGEGGLGQGNRRGGWGQGDICAVTRNTQSC